MIQRDQETVTGKEAASYFIDSYEHVSNITTPNNRKQQVHDEIKNHHADQDPPEYTNGPFNKRSFKEALKTLKDKKSDGPDKITNEILEHFGTKAKSKLLGIFNNSCKRGHVPQSLREADMVLIHKTGKVRTNTDRYRPIGLTSYVGTFMERLFNTRLEYHPEKNIIPQEQTGFQQHRSTKD